MPLFRRNRDVAANNTSHVANVQQFAQQAEVLIPAEVRMISGCHSEQTSADVSNVNCLDGQLPQPAGRSGGACTSALLKLLYEKQNQKLTFQQVLVDLRTKLADNGFDQIPQLTSSRPLEMQETPFSLVGPGNGTRRAVLVGINYYGQSGQLSGCHNDVLNIKKYIMEKQGYRSEHILVLMDDGQHHYPTREKIIRALRQLVAQSVSGDSVYFHYSGHGGLLSPEWNIFKKNHKEYDETLYPLDHSQAGQIRDFSLFNHFVKPMAAGVTVTCVMDCCHSGSVLDLPYSYQPTSAGTIRMRQNIDSLSNLAFLYILAGGMLPPGELFEDIAENIQNVTGGDIDAFQGTGLDEMNFDTEPCGFTPDGDAGDFENADPGDFDTADDEDYGPDGQDDFPDTGYDTRGGDTYGDYGGYNDAYPSGSGDDDVNTGDFGEGDVDCDCLGNIFGMLRDMDDFGND